MDLRGSSGCPKLLISGGIFLGGWFIYGFLLRCVRAAEAWVEARVGGGGLCPLNLSTPQAGAVLARGWLWGSGFGVTDGLATILSELSRIEALVIVAQSK